MKKFNYDGIEFFYDKSFQDYPIANSSAIYAMDEYINSHIITWSFTNNMYYHTFNGNELQNLALTLLKSYVFSEMTSNNFEPLNTSIINERLRILNYEPSRESNLKIHSDLRIISINIRAIKNENRFQTAHLYITAYSETFDDMPL